MSTEKIFADGMNFYQNDNAPEFIIGDMEFKVEEAIAFLMKHVKANGKCRVTAKISKGGNIYCELNTWEPKKKEEESVAEESVAEESFEDEEGEDLPF